MYVIMVVAVVLLIVGLEAVYVMVYEFEVIVMAKVVTVEWQP